MFEKSIYKFNSNYSLFYTIWLNIFKNYKIRIVENMRSLFNISFGERSDVKKW